MNLKGMVNHFDRLDGGFKSAQFQDFELRTAFQPVYAVSGEIGVLYGVEALVRPLQAGKSIQPLDFFAMLDKPDAFAADWVCLTLHLANAAAWHLKGTSLFVNLNPDASHRVKDMASGFDAYVRLADDLGISAERLIIEITERRAGCDDGLASLVRHIKSLGCKVAVDDFGIEGSNLARVVALQPDIVKIDRIWFNAMMRDTASRSLVKAVASRVQGMGAKVVFEGVETAEEFNWARECGADLIQGWLFGKATYADEEPSDHCVRTPANDVLKAG
ncbi:MAG: EAL domain-containing protein [Hyphomonadaceae bacterium]